MYFVWEKNSRLSNQYAHFANEPKGFELTDWITGKSLIKPPSLFRIRSDEGGATTLTDLVLTGFNLQIFSPKLMELLLEEGVKNIEYVPVELLNHETDEVVTSYRIANILGKIECLDVENSRCKRFSDGELRSVTKFKVDMEKLEGNMGAHQSMKLFRLGEFPFIILVHEVVKAAVEAAGITGVKFIEPSKYV